MRTPLDNSIQKINSPGLGVAGLLLIFLLVLAGCESPSGAPGVRPGGSAPGRPGAQALGRPSAPGSGRVTPGAPRKIADVPAGRNSLAGASGNTNPVSPTSATKSVEAQKQAAMPSAINPLAPTAKVEQAGNTVELASLIIAAKTNPFLDWLPKPLLPVEPTVTGVEVPAGTPVDPFAKVNLLGVIYNAKSMVALVSAGDNQTQFVKKNDLVDLETGQAKVTAVRADGIDLQMLDDITQKRVFTLPDIIGYDPNAATGNANETNLTAPEQPSSQSKSKQPLSADGANLPALGKLRRMMEPSVPASERASGKGARVDLQEP